MSEICYTKWYMIANHKEGKPWASEEVKIYEGSVTLELHGYLADLKVNLPAEEDIEGGDYDLGKTPF